jgi:hypothetical protein
MLLSSQDRLLWRLPYEVLAKVVEKMLIHYSMCACVCGDVHFKIMYAMTVSWMIGELQQFFFGKWERQHKMISFLVVLLELRVSISRVKTLGLAFIGCT